MAKELVSGAIINLGFIDKVEPVFYLEALVTKVLGERGVSNRAIYAAFAVNLQG
ncbi:MAG: hypothetical protein ABGY95_10940 [Rubritalea sp.]|uniref:hypothetical protein n=1 Tax=Rubritalea sp. TaxID=2109375 RepID=UPI0032422BD9